MWWRFFTFCVLVSFILFVVVTSIYGRPVIHLFFHRCCGEDIENDQVIFENFGNNLKERLVGGDIIEVDNETLFEAGDIGRLDDVGELLSINDPEVKKWINDQEINGDSLDLITENAEAKQVHDGVTEGKEMITNKYELLEEEMGKLIETDSSKEFLNVHDNKHKRMANIL